MSEEHKITTNMNIQDRIFNIRGQQVMLDSDLAAMYQVQTKVLNQAVKRNIERFPTEFRFQLAETEFEKLNKCLRSQPVTSKDNRGGRRYLPFVFTEQGVSMLSAVLRSSTAIQVSIAIINAFVEMRKFISTNAALFQRLDAVEQKQLKTDCKVEQILNAIEDKSLKPKQGIFFDGQIFDAHTFVCDIIKSAKYSIVLVDNYVDDSVLTLLTKRHNNCGAVIYTQKISKELVLDLKKHNQQYPEITVQKLTKSHDRFIIIDEKVVYHFGASLKDLGKKWFAFSQMEMPADELLQKLKKKVR